MTQRNRPPLGSSRRTSSRITRRGSGRPGASPSAGPALKGGGLYLLLFGAPLVLLVLGWVVYSRPAEMPPAPVVNEEDDYRKSKRLESEAEPHISGLFAAKRRGNKTKVQSEFREAKDKLVSALELLEKLKMRYTDDNTLDGNLPDRFAYLDRDLERLQKKYHQIIKEVEY